MKKVYAILAALFLVLLLSVGIYSLFNLNAPFSKKGSRISPDYTPYYQGYAHINGRA